MNKHLENLISLSQVCQVVRIWYKYVDVYRGKNTTNENAKRDFILCWKKSKLNGGNPNKSTVTNVVTQKQTS